jgi:hypothetical protein
VKSLGVDRDIVNKMTIVTQRRTEIHPSAHSLRTVIISALRTTAPTLSVNVSVFDHSKDCIIIQFVVLAGIAGMYKEAQVDQGLGGDVFVEATV